MDVDMYVDSLHSTDFHAWERGNTLHGLPTQLCNVVWTLVLRSQTLAKESGYTRLTWTLDPSGYARPEVSGVWTNSRHVLSTNPHTATHKHIYSSHKQRVTYSLMKLIC